MILDDIIKVKRQSLEKFKRELPLETLRKRLEKKDIKRRSFKKAIEPKKRAALIAEIKKASPRLGILRKNFDPAKIARTYERCGADAISVITEEKFFLGSLKNLIKVRGAVRLPVLRKDFLIDEYQVYESAYLGADAILLIARILTKKQLLKFAKIAKEFDMDALAEVHDKADLKKVLEIDSIDIIGINNRDLSTFKVNFNTTRDLMRLIPKDKLVVSESGIRNNKDVTFLEGLGVSAVLIGETFMKSTDIGKKIKEIMGR